MMMPVLTLSNDTVLALSNDGVMALSNDGVLTLPTYQTAYQPIRGPTKGPTKGPVPSITTRMSPLRTPATSAALPGLSKDTLAPAVSRKARRLKGTLALIPDTLAPAPAIHGALIVFSMDSRHALVGTLIPQVLVIGVWFAGTHRAVSCSSKSEGRVIHFAAGGVCTCRTEPCAHRAIEASMRHGGIRVHIFNPYTP